MHNYQACIQITLNMRFFKSALWETVTFYVSVTGVPNLNSLLVKRQIDNPSPGAVTGGKLVALSYQCERIKSTS